CSATSPRGASPLDREALFDVWVHPGAIWAEWVKPVLFAHLPRPLPPFSPPALPDLTWAPAPGERWAAVVDLPGPLSVAVGRALAEKGYRPVPLFNGCPPPEGAEDRALTGAEQVLAGMVEGGPRLQALPLPLDAPPAFLVDADRNRPHRSIQAEMFDNRSTLFETDFPSGSSSVPSGSGGRFGCANAGASPRTTSGTCCAAGSGLACPWGPNA